jgi:hypothetical protein
MKIVERTLDGLSNKEEATVEGDQKNATDKGF